MKEKLESISTKTARGPGQKKRATRRKAKNQRENIVEFPKPIKPKPERTIMKKIEERKNKKISFVIPMIHDYPYIYATVNDIQAEMQDSKYRWEIIVAENGSVDINTPHFQKLYAVPMRQGLIKYVFEPRQCGPLSRNAGAAIADGDYIIFMDSHTTLGKGSIDTMADYLEQDKECGCLIGLTAKSHYDPLRSGAFYECFHPEKEQIRKGGPTIATHMHGTYMSLGRIHADIRAREECPKVVMGSQAYTMYRLNEFLEIGGYFEEARFYPHPEGYMPLKFWMKGQTVNVCPTSWHLHGMFPRRYFDSGPERRKKTREYGETIDGRFYNWDTGEHGARNVMMIANIIGGQKWLDICYEALVHHHGRERNLPLLKESAFRLSEPERERLAPQFKYSLDDILIKARTEGIPGMEKWDRRIQEDDPLA